MWGSSPEEHGNHGSKTTLDKVASALFMKCVAHQWMDKISYLGNFDMRTGKRDMACSGRVSCPVVMSTSNLREMGVGANYCQKGKTFLFFLSYSKKVSSVEIRQYWCFESSFSASMALQKSCANGVELQSGIQKQRPHRIYDDPNFTVI